MPVQWGKVEVPLTGLDQKTAAAHVLPGGLVNAENVRFDSLGNLTKRTGWDVLAPAVATQTPYRLVSHRDGMHVCDERFFFAYTYGTGNWYTRGASPKYHVERLRAVRPSDSTSTASSIYDVADVAEANGFRVIACRYNSGANVNTRVMVFEASTGAMLDDHDIGPTVTDHIVRLVAVGNFVFVVFGESGDIRFIRYNMGADPISRTAEASLSSQLTNAISAGVFDAGPIEGDSSEWVIAGKANASNNVEIEVFDTAATPVSQRNATLSSGTGTPQQPFAVGGYIGEDIYMAWDDGTNTKIWSVTEAGLASNFAATNIFTQRADRLGIRRLISTYAAIVGDYDNSGVPTLLYNNCSDTGTTGTTRTVAGLHLAAEPWRHDGKISALTYYPSSTDASDPTFYIYELTNTSNNLVDDPVLLGTVARTVAYRETARSTVPHTYDPDSNNRFLTGVSINVDFAALDEDSFITDRVGADFLLVDARVSYLFDHRFLSAPWGPSLFMAGAQPMLFDGDKMRDSGHTMRPDFDSADLTVHAGGSTFKYVIVWEWTNAQGQIERSSPSAVVTGSSATTSMSHAIVVPIVVPGNRYDAAVDVRGAIYRTEADGSLYYLVGHDDPGDTFTDTVTDANLILNEPLYTDGGVLPNIGPPACTHVTEHRERLFAVGLDSDPEGIAFTKVYKLGTAPEWVADAFVIRIPGAHKLTAVASLDTALVVFSKTNTWLVFGDGPPDTGANLGAGVGGIAGFQVQHVTGDVGCDNPRSIVVTPQGIMFQSGKGIYMLDRSYSMQKAGAVVDRILDSYSKVTGATLVPDKTEVHFALSDGGAAEDGARILVYDYFAEFWAVDNLAVGTGITSIAAYDGAAVSTPELFISDLNGSIYKSDLSNYDDAGSFYAMRLETGPIALDTIAGYQRVRRVTIGGYGAGAHGLSVDFEYDNDKNTVGTWDDTVSRSEAQMTASGYPVRINLPRQKTRTLRMRLTETTPAGSAGEVVWSTVVFEAGFKQGTTKLPAINTG